MILNKSDARPEAQMRYLGIPFCLTQMAEIKISTPNIQIHMLR